jgi:hypothetical protein
MLCTNSGERDQLISGLEGWRQAPQHTRTQNVSCYFLPSFNFRTSDLWVIITFATENATTITARIIAQKVELCECLNTARAEAHSLFPDDDTGEVVKGHVTAVGHGLHRYTVFYVRVVDVRAIPEQSNGVGRKTLVPSADISYGKFGGWRIRRKHGCFVQTSDVVTRHGFDGRG